MCIPHAAVPAAYSHLPPKKKLRTASEAGADPGCSKAAADAGPVKKEESSTQQQQELKDVKDSQQQQNSESTAATTTTTSQMHPPPPPAYSRQHSCMEMDEDVSASLPSEIRCVGE